ncbi:expressed unknown protein [Seminavis robusta]|uniref:Uncharacterized protein n=1 Tax=Seminavis robusta TaxID=568900 RepID=A0A9N8DUQ1_9STRA|nr:expressed unknown protein [Seminavis robusta]|eukprot:Sro365_g127311.1  (102) ;mRNA; f:12427-12732
MSSTVLSYNLVLMDGSGTMFKATVNSGLSHYFAAYNSTLDRLSSWMTMPSSRRHPTVATRTRCTCSSRTSLEASPNKKVIDLLPIIMRDVVPATGHIYRAR